MAAAIGDKDFATEAVPESERIAWPLVFFAELGIATALFYMQVTSVIAQSYGSRIAIIAIIYASVLSALVGYAVCRISVTTGFGVNLMARQVMGFRGSALFSLIYGTNSFVYFAVEATIMGSSLQHFLPGMPLQIVLPVIALAMVPLVWFGMRILARAQVVTFVLYAVLLAAALFVSFGIKSGPKDWLHYTPAAIFSGNTGLLVAIGTMNSVIFITGLVGGDYARFIRPIDQRIGTLVVGLGCQAFCFAFSGLLGLWFSTHYGESNPGAYFVAMLGGWGIVFAIATQLRINLSNMYSGSLAFLNMLVQVADIQLSRHVMVVIFGVAISVALVLNVFANLAVVLGVIGMFTTCFTCLVLVEYYILRPLPHHQLVDEAPDWRWPAVGSLLVATTIGCALQTGVLGAGFAAMASMIAALGQSVIFIVSDRMMQRRSVPAE